MNPERNVELAGILATLNASPQDRAAWELLYVNIWPYVYGIVYSFLHGRKELAEDVTQKVFIRLIQYCPFSEIKHPPVFRSYVAITARNVARDAIRRLLGAKEVSIEALPNMQDFQEAGMGPSVDEADLRYTLDQLLSDLSPQDVQLLRLHLEGSRLSEIAEKAGISYSNVAVRLHRLKKRLRERLSGE